MSLKTAPAIPLDRVEWRVDGQPTGEGNSARCRFVPYLDARDIASLLDEWVGPTNWRDEYEPVSIDGKAALLCHLSIWDDDRGWVTKTDVGVPSNFEAQKGAVSDAFKRAGCLKWGAGRNVYDLPTVWAPCRTYLKGGKPQAAPNDKSIPAILAELKKQGIDAAGGRVRGETEPAADEAEQPTDEATQKATVDVIAPEVVDEWKGMIAAIGDEVVEQGVRRRMAAKFGKVTELPANSAHVVEEWLTAEIARVTGPIDTTAPDIDPATLDAEAF